MSCFNKLLAIAIVWVGTSILPVRDIASAIAAEEVIFYDGMASVSVSIQELEDFANAGNISPALEFLLKLSRQNPQLVRYGLKQEFLVEIIWLKNILNSQPGEWLLRETGKTVHPKSKQANLQALRGSLLQSASDDRQVSLLEVLQNYPTRQVYVNGAVFSQPFKPFNEVF